MSAPTLPLSGQPEWVRAGWQAFADGIFRKPKPRRWASPLDMACDLDKTMVRTPALEVINAKLVTLADKPGQGRLATFLSPQEGKSTLCSYWNPLWLLVDDPDRRILIISYGDDIARRWGADIKRALETFNGDDGTVDLGLKLQPDSKAAGRWSIAGHRGGVVCAGIGGQITGRPGDCLRGNSRIITDRGYITIRQLHEWTGELPRVLSYNHQLGRNEWRRVIASRAIADRPLVEICTESGRVIQCTADHRVYVHGVGYVAAAELQPGQRLVAADEGPGRVRQLRHGVHQAPVDAVAHDAGRAVALFEGVSVRGGDGGVDVRGLPRRVHEAALRGREGQAQGLPADVLHESMLPGVRVQAGGGPRQHGDGGTTRAAHHGYGDPDRHWPAALLRRRDGGPVGRGEPQAGMRVLRRDPQEQVRDVPGLLDASAGLDLPDVELYAVRIRIHEDARGAREGATRRSDQRVLRIDVPSPVDARASVGHLRALRRADEDRGREAVLLARMPSRGTERASGAEGEAVPAMREGVRVQQRPADVLRSDLRGHGARRPDGRDRQLAVQGRHQLRPVVQGDASAHHGARRQPMPGVRHARPTDTDWPEMRSADEVDPGTAPHQRAALGQPGEEPDPALSVVPHGAPQVEADAVSVVRELRGVRDTVYDLQVDGNRNFFAEQVLVHNCIIVDDPLKNLEEAQSSKYRDRGMRTWQGTLIPRMAPHTKVFWIQTLWHESEPIMQILANEGSDWDVIRIPAICDSPDDPLGREIGEPMVSARGDRDWAKIRRDVGEYVFSALYQQRPAPAEGGLFKRLWWRYWSPAPSNGYGDRLDLAGRVWPVRETWRFLTVDLAASTRTSSDYTVAAAWALTLDGDLVLLDRTRAKVGEANHFDLVRPLAARWQVDTAFVEATQHSMTLTAEATRGGLHVTPLRAETDKFSRALPYSARVSAGRVWLPGGAAWTDDWVSEHASFPNSAHDDQVDVGSYAVRVAVTKWAPPPPKPVERIREPDLFAGVFGTSGPTVDLLSIPL